MKLKFKNILILIISVLVIVISSCDGGVKQDLDVHHTVRPKDIPLTNCSGDTIEWNWNKQRAYQEKRLFIERDSNGCILMLVIKIK